MSRKKNHEQSDAFVPELSEPDEPAELVEHVEQEKPPGAFEVVVEDYEADQSIMPGPTIETEDTKPKVTDNEFGVDLSHLTPTARERTLAEMREGRRQLDKWKER